MSAFTHGTKHIDRARTAFGYQFNVLVMPRLTKQSVDIRIVGATVNLSQRHQELPQNSGAKLPVPHMCGDQNSGPATGLHRFQMLTTDNFNSRIGAVIRKPVHMRELASSSPQIVPNILKQGFDFAIRQFRENSSNVLCRHAGDTHPLTDRSKQKTTNRSAPAKRQNPDCVIERSDKQRLKRIQQPSHQKSRCRTAISHRRPSLPISHPIAPHYAIQHGL